MTIKANAQKNTLLKNAQANAESNFFKRVFFSPPKNPPLLFLQIYFSHRTGSLHNLTVSASNVNHHTGASLRYCAGACARLVPHDNKKQFLSWRAFATRANSK